MKITSSKHIKSVKFKSSKYNPETNKMIFTIIDYND